MSTRTVVFIHGNFVNYQSWDNWVARYEARGYRCIAIPYPGRDKTVEALRKTHPDPTLGKLSLEKAIEHHVNIIAGMDEPPIIIAHSFGGLIAQLLVNRGLGAAAVVIDSVPPMGVLTTKLSFYRGTFPVLNPLVPASQPYLMTFKDWQYTFTNGMSLDEQRRAYDKYLVPESRRLSRGGLGFKARINFKKSHAPLLFIAGEKDHLMPAALNKANFKRYQASAPSITDFKEFPGRTHFSVIGGKGWEEVADYAINWVEQFSGTVNLNGRREPAQVVAMR
ncbi:MAG: alpha/beta fold hydrolase [Chloroflexi bacterium]|nr:alpha/beta fold hydrolase [Chloroflexota bacterium]